jgi:hypothetical protein
MRFIIDSAKAAALLVLGTAGFAFTPHARACGEPRSRPRSLPSQRFHSEGLGAQYESSAHSDIRRTLGDRRHF